MADTQQSTIASKPVQPGQGCHELILAGRIYADVAPRLKSEVMGLADAGLRTLLVDAQALEQIDSSGLNVFVHLLKRIRPQGRIVFFGLNQNLQRVFQITKLNKVVEVTETREQALETVTE